MREVLGGGSGGRYYADGEDTIHVVPDSRNLPTEFTEGRFPLRVERLGPGAGLRRRRPVPRRLRLREAHPGAARRALHVDRRPLDPRLLGRQGRQGGAAVPGHRRPGRPRRARRRRARRRRAADGRHRRPHPDDGRRRLGRPARPPGRGGAARHRLAQGRRSPAPGRTTASWCRSTAPADADATEALRGAAGRPHRRGAVLRPRPRLRHPVRRAAFNEFDVLAALADRPAARGDHHHHHHRRRVDGSGSGWAAAGRGRPVRARVQVGPAGQRRRVDRRRPVRATARSTSSRRPRRRSPPTATATTGQPSHRFGRARPGALPVGAPVPPARGRQGRLRRSVSQRTPPGSSPTPHRQVSKPRPRTGPGLVCWSTRVEGWSGLR